MRIGNATSADGEKTTEDLVSVSSITGEETVVHPLQIGTLDGPAGEFVGWGTYKGYGTHQDGAISNCADDYTGWNVYVDGIAFTHYFCRAIGVQLGDAATGNKFKILYETTPPTACGSVAQFVFYLNNAYQECERINGSEGQGAGGGEVVGRVDLNNEVEYYDIQKRTSGTFTSWTSGTSECDGNYDVTVFQADDFQPEPQ